MALRHFQFRPEPLIFSCLAVLPDARDERRISNVSPHRIWPCSALSPKLQAPSSAHRHLSERIYALWITIVSCSRGAARGQGYPRVTLSPTTRGYFILKAMSFVANVHLQRRTTQLNVST
ncbi:hypothetical protein BV22DRAFT_240757 [Leucogyrophana mollusca]|uniref:Uncharacterized protein n=1 Tax=Leucogyrophana mollusca TaxID=85980 RepID=A0ACB8BSP0_9AGAM|nr:hypothetical protein BV22DRAFT_240757 [Leucogyrophana mollusca]